MFLLKNLSYAVSESVYKSVKLVIIVNKEVFMRKSYIVAMLKTYLIRENKKIFERNIVD